MKIEYGCRWEEAIETALEKLGGGKEVLRVDFDADYQGYLDIDVLLNDGRVFSYCYYYGSCLGCDPWEDSEYDEGYDSKYPKLADHIINEATFFDNIEQYQLWAKNIPDRYDRSKT